MYVVYVLLMMYMRQLSRDNVEERCLLDLLRMWLLILSKTIKLIIFS